MFWDDDDDELLYIESDTSQESKVFLTTSMFMRIRKSDW